MTAKAVWMPKSPRLTSKSKIAYVMRELFLGDGDKAKAIEALQGASWNMRNAIARLKHAAPIS